MRHPVAGPAGNVLFPALLYDSGFKAEFGYDSRKGVGPCDRDPSGLGNAGEGLKIRSVSLPAL